ncbi:glycerophosphodiester phosphodiesterase family protein [Isoptericola sp. b490]|uniref:glycerophosphodiester phosphodiesterase n=1 Tax=Actinotalea lenta TaxID=3064654 RepID=UPI002712D84F|nr:glycerophosphodiester phosphodiesterase family protein [Isoptericola sp. b490]MDO8122227.1 glycerophosphodiester phosphodiesterase family protein [Isoptericola sp. b490]
MSSTFRQRVVGRRGAAALAPENTLAAFEAGYRAGADVLHVDLRLTADWHVVAMHDETVDATTDGDGRVGDLDLASLRGLDAGSWFDPRFAGERVPTWDEVLELAVVRDVDVLAHLHGSWSGLEAALVTDAVLDAGFGARTTAASSDPGTLEAVAAAEPGVRRSLVLHRSDPDLVARCVDLALDTCSPHGRLLIQQPGLVARLHDAGVGVLGWALDDPALWRRAVDLDVDAIVTDDPERLRAWLRPEVPAQRRAA